MPSLGGRNELKEQSAKEKEKSVCFTFLNFFPVHFK